MLNVVLYVPTDPGWIGGQNYFVNLATAVLSRPDTSISLHVLGHPETLPEPLNLLPGVPSTTSWLRYSPRWFVQKIRKKLLGNDMEQADALKSAGMHLFSHGWPLGIHSPVPAAVWIPDFQHKHLPHMFSAHELAMRDSEYARYAKYSQAVLLSSDDARKDFEMFYPDYGHKAHVLRFVSQVAVLSSLPDRQPVLDHYAVTEPFFHIPNQLWKHKNHIVVVEALKILKDRGRCPLVVSTGNTEDYRNPTFFAKLQERVTELGLEDRMRFLGLIPFTHVCVLMRAALAIINPSLFEGWSTTVEEAKTLGKKLFLSNIPVHKEQAPERGQFFTPDSPEELAALMNAALSNYSPEEEEMASRRAIEAFPNRQRAFALEYEKIVKTIVGAR